MYEMESQTYVTSPQSFTWIFALSIIYTSIFGLSERIPAPITYALRYAGFYLAMCLATLYGLAAFVGLRIIGCHEYTMWTAGRFLAWMIYLTTGISFEISEQDQAKLTSPKPAIFVLNHQTEMDAIIFSKICPKRCTMMGKSSLKHIPIFGWILGWVGFIFVDRNDVGRATKTLENAVKMIRNRYYSILVCPEGTRSRFTEPKLLPFKRGAFYLAIRAGVPIIPVVAENYSRVLSSKTKTFRAEKIKVRVLDPIPTAHLMESDVEVLTNSVRGKMLESLIDMDRKSK